MTLEKSSMCMLLAILAATCLASKPGGATAAEATDEGGEERLLHGFGKIAGHMGWDLAGFGTLGILLGKKVSHLQIAVRGMGGQAMDSSGTSLGAGGEAGYRGIWRVHRKIRLTAAVAPSYLFRTWKSKYTGNVFRYHVPMAGIGFGVFFGEGSGRFSHGIEISFDAGYAIQFSPERGSGSSDYSGFYGSGGIGWMMMI